MYSRRVIVTLYYCGTHTHTRTHTHVHTHTTQEQPKAAYTNYRKQHCKIPHNALQQKVSTKEITNGRPALRFAGETSPQLRSGEDI